MEATMNMTMNGTSPIRGGADPLEGLRLAVERVAQDGQQHAGHHQEQRQRARVAAQLRQHAGGGRERHAGRHRTTSTVSVVVSVALDQAQEGLAEVIAAGAPANLVGGLGRHQATLAHEQQQLALGRLVHHVAGHQDGGAPLGQGVEGGPQLAPQERVEADGGLVQHQQVGPPDQRDPQRDP